MKCFHLVVMSCAEQGSGCKYDELSHPEKEDFSLVLKPDLLCSWCQGGFCKSREDVALLLTGWSVAQVIPDSYTSTTQETKLGRNHH